MKRGAIILTLGLIEISVYGFEIPFRDRKGDAGAPGGIFSGFSASARQAAMGGTGVVSKGADATYFNPAGLAGTNIGEMYFMSAPLMEAGQFTSLSFMYPMTRRDSLGVMINQIESGEAEKTDDFGQSLGNFEEKNILFKGAYAKKVRDWITVGVGSKYVRQTLADKSAAGYGADAGAVLNFFRDRFSIGFAMDNILAPHIKLSDQKETFTRVGRVGVLTTAPLWGRKLTVTADVSKGGGSASRWGLGFEIDPFELMNSPVFLRWGINQREYSLGLGIAQGPISFDYALALHEVELMHRFGLSFKYGLFQSFSPTTLDRMRKEVEEERARLVREKSKIKSEQDILEQVEELSELRSQALKLFQKGEYEEANIKAYEILKIEPADESAKRLISEVRVVREKKRVEEILSGIRSLYKEKRYRDVVQMVDKNMESLKENTDVNVIYNLSLAQVHIEQEKYVDAQNALIKVIENEPNNQQAVLLYKRLESLRELLSGGGR